MYLDLNIHSYIVLFFFWILFAFVLVSALLFAGAILTQIGNFLLAKSKRWHDAISKGNH